MTNDHREERALVSVWVIINIICLYYNVYMIATEKSVSVTTRGVRRCDCLHPIIIIIIRLILSLRASARLQVNCCVYSDHAHLH